MRVCGVLVRSDSDIDHRGNAVIGLQVAPQYVFVLQAGAEFSNVVRFAGALQTQVTDNRFKLA